MLPAQTFTHRAFSPCVSTFLSPAQCVSGVFVLFSRLKPATVFLAMGVAQALEEAEDSFGLHGLPQFGGNLNCPLRLVSTLKGSNLPKRDAYATLSGLRSEWPNQPSGVARR
jgi:hypothetical protein